MTRLLAETDSDNIKLINSYICEKNALLTEKKQALIEHIETTRKKIQKDLHSLNVIVDGCSTTSKIELSARRRYSWIKIADPPPKI